MPDPRESDAFSVSGDLYLLPFLNEGLVRHAQGAFAELADEYGPENVLVLKRFPTGIDRLESTLGEAVSSIAPPAVHGLSAHARLVLEELPETPRVLTPSEQGLLLTAFAEEYDWEAPYLRRAAEQESFAADAGRFVAEATWQGSRVETDDPVLAELARFNRAFHDWLGEHDLLDPADVLATATEALEDSARRDRIQAPFDAILALEFEEFTAIDRDYLARLSAGVPLACIAERDSAIQRTWNEGGRIEAYAPTLRRHEVAVNDPLDGPLTVASFLATGESTGATDAEGVAVIEGATFEDQIGSIADEIERLRRTEGLTYDDCAVVLRDANAPIPQTLRLLQNMGIPVASATVGGLEHDPAARELYALISWCCANDRGSDTGWGAERSRAVLAARVPTLRSSDELLTAIEELGNAEGVGRALERWCRETDLKRRVARSESPLDAKTQFDHVRDVLSLAEFLDRTPLLEASWERLCDGLEREMERASSDKIATELETPTEGVLVDAARVAKNVARDAVFLVNAVDRDYPADPLFNALFPTPHLERLDGYPAFTSPTEADVDETFSTDSAAAARPLHAYYAELSRRMLAVGARAADDRLYFTTFREEVGGTGNNLRPSRFLAAAEAVLGSFDRVTHDGIHSHGSAVAFALSRVDRTFSDVRRAGVVGDPVDVGDVEKDFALVQTILENDPPAELREAIRTRLDFATGVVARE